MDFTMRAKSKLKCTVLVLIKDVIEKSEPWTCISLKDYINVMEIYTPRNVHLRYQGGDLQAGKHINTSKCPK